MAMKKNANDIFKVKLQKTKITKKKNYVKKRQGWTDFTSSWCIVGRAKKAWTVNVSIRFFRRIGLKRSKIGEKKRNFEFWFSLFLKFGLFLSIDNESAVKTWRQGYLYLRILRYPCDLITFPKIRIFWITTKFWIDQNFSIARSNKNL